MGIQPPSAGCGTCEQILDNFADLHELIQTGRLGDELGNSEVLEQSLVPPGPGRAPHAHWNAAEVCGASDLAQDVFTGILGQVQVHQDEVWNCRIRIGPLPADESEGLASAQQVNQFKPEFLLMQGPIEKEDVRAVVFNDKDSGCGNNRSVFQAHPPADNYRRPLFIIPQPMVAPFAATSAGPPGKGPGERLFSPSHALRPATAPLPPELSASAVIAARSAGIARNDSATNLETTPKEKPHRSSS